MLVVVAIEAKVFPVTAVRGTIVMVVVLVVYGKFMEVLEGELTATASTYPRMDFQGLLPISLFLFRP